MYKLCGICAAIAIVFLLTGCQADGRGEFATPAVPSLQVTTLDETTTPKPLQTPPRWTPIPSTPLPTPKPPLTERDIALLRRCMNNAIHREIYYAEEDRCEFEKYNAQQITVRVYGYFGEPMHSSWTEMIFSVSGDVFSFGLARSYLNGPVVNSFGTPGEEHMARLAQRGCDGEFTFDFVPDPAYDFKNQYFDRWPQIREAIIANEMDRFSENHGETYWLHFCLYTEEYAESPGEAEVYYFVGPDETCPGMLLRAYVFEDDTVSYGWGFDLSEEGDEYFFKMVFDTAKIVIP